MAAHYPPGSKLLSPLGVTGQFRQDSLKAMAPEWLPTSVNRRRARASAKLDAIVYPLIEERRRLGVVCRCR